MSLLDIARASVPKARHQHVSLNATALRSRFKYELLLMTLSRYPMYCNYCMAVCTGAPEEMDNLVRQSRAEQTVRPERERLRPHASGASRSMSSRRHASDQGRSRREAIVRLGARSETGWSDPREQRVLVSCVATCGFSAQRWTPL